MGRIVSAEEMVEVIFPVRFRLALSIASDPDKLAALKDDLLDTVWAACTDEHGREEALTLYTPEEGEIAVGLPTLDALDFLNARRLTERMGPQ